MTENEKIAALAAALDGMKAERNWYRTAWTEAFHERNRLEGDLEHAQNTVARLIEERDEAQCELRKHYGERGPTCVKWLAEGGMREG